MGPRKIPRLTGITSSDDGKRWKVCHDTQVLYADFQGRKLDLSDERQLLAFMKRDDYAIVCSGLLDMDPDQIKWKSLLAGDSRYHRFRRCAVSGSMKQYLPQISTQLTSQQDFANDGADTDLLSLTLSDFSGYLDRFTDLVAKHVLKDDGQQGNKKRFNMGTETKADALALANLEVSMKTNPKLYEEFVSRFGFHGSIHGCSVTKNVRTTGLCIIYSGQLV